MVHVLVGEVHDRVRQSGGEHHGLSLVVRRQAAQQKAQVAQKTHVEQAIGLVDDQDLDAAQRVDPLFQVVDQSPRRADEDVAAVTQAIALLVVVDAAVDGVHGQAGELAQRLGVRIDLHRQLARRRDHQSARARARCRARAGE
jgi:hypothetical protein